MRTVRLAGVAALAVFASYPIHAPSAEEVTALEVRPIRAPAGASAEAEALTSGPTEHVAARERLDRDLDAMRTYRPGFAFWAHVFSVPDGRVAYGSATEGRLLATFPVKGDWVQAAHWEQHSYADLFANQPLARGLVQRREDTARLLAEAAGPIVHHATRGSFVEPGAERYGPFLSEWGIIFERFGVPAEIGLAQALMESGLRGRIRSEAGALGFCQWMPTNWARIKRLSPHVLEGYNQTSQAPYCAAHLTILAAKYGSFIPALSEHHAGGVNVGRAITSGSFAGGRDIRERYFLGGELTLLIRQIGLPGYREVAGSYGPRSFRYAELVFGNMSTIASLEASVPQQRIYAMRARRSTTLEEVTRRTGLSADEVRRFNPALVNQVPAGANLYLPFHVDELGTDTAFWHRPPSREYAAALDEFLRLDERYAPEDWDDQSVVESLRAFEKRFRATDTEEGTVMAVMIAYVIEDLVRDDRMEILTRFRSDDRVRRLIELGAREREARFPNADDSGGWAHRTAVLSGLSIAAR
jgi:hypothetical protein